MKTTEEILAWVDRELAYINNIKSKEGFLTEYGWGGKNHLESLREFITSEDVE